MLNLDSWRVIERRKVVSSIDDLAVLTCAQRASYAGNIG